MEFVMIWREERFQVVRLWWEFFNRISWQNYMYITWWGHSHQHWETRVEWVKGTRQCWFPLPSDPPLCRSDTPFAQLSYHMSEVLQQDEAKSGVAFLGSIPLPQLYPAIDALPKKKEKKEKKNKRDVVSREGRGALGMHNLKDWQPLPMLEMYVGKLKLQCLCTNLIFCETWTRSLLLLLIIMMMYYSWPAMWIAWGRLLAVMFLTVVHHSRIHSSSFQ